MKIIFRADGGKHIGLGHLIRSIALAEIINKTFDCFLYTREIPEKIVDQLTSAFKNVKVLPEMNQDDEFIYLSNEFRNEHSIFVLDGYNFSSNNQLRLSKNGNIVLCIDDLQDVHYFADAVINHSPNINPEDISKESYTKLYLGINYLILRQAFLKSIGTNKAINLIENLFICLGGSDPQNLTWKILDACLKTKLFKEIHVVLGASYNSYDQIRQFFNEKNVKFFVNISAEEIILLMKKSDLAICPASSIALEVKCVGLKLITGYYAENQKHLANILHNEGFAYSLGDINLIEEEYLINKIEYYVKYQIWRTEKELVKKDSTQNLLDVFVNFAKKIENA